MRGYWIFSAGHSEHALLTLASRCYVVVVTPSLAISIGLMAARSANMKSMMTSVGISSACFGALETTRRCFMSRNPSFAWVWAAGTGQLRSSVTPNLLQSLPTGCHFFNSNEAFSFPPETRRRLAHTRRYFARALLLQAERRLAVILSPPSPVRLCPQWSPLERVLQ